jgi:hypothetical protein
MGSRQLRATIATITVMLALTVAWVTTPASTRLPSGELLAAHEDLPVLTGDVTPEIRELAALVVDTARRHGVPVVATELEIRFVDRVEPGEFIAGRTDGRLILVGRNVARPDLTLLHEISHAVVGLEHGHGEPWRTVYVSAVGELFGERRAERELRRIRWVYDKSYLDHDLP